MTTLSRDAAGAPPRGAARAAARRPLRPVDRLLRAPLGLLYLVLLVLLALPVAALMTLLYYAARVLSAARRVSRTGPARDPRSIAG